MTRTKDSFIRKKILLLTDKSSWGGADPRDYVHSASEWAMYIGNVWTPTHPLGSGHLVGTWKDTVQSEYSGDHNEAGDIWNMLWYTGPEIDDPDWPL